MSDGEYKSKAEKQEQKRLRQSLNIKFISKEDKLTERFINTEEWMKPQKVIKAHWLNIIIMSNQYCYCLSCVFKDKPLLLYEIKNSEDTLETIKQ